PWRWRGCGPAWTVRSKAAPPPSPRPFTPPHRRWGYGKAPERQMGLRPTCTDEHQPRTSRRKLARNRKLRGLRAGACCERSRAGVIDFPRRGIYRYGWGDWRGGEKKRRKIKIF